ncbi:MAG: TetR/AcrR family transcriptional regulator [Actinomycetota bacterium]
MARPAKFDDNVILDRATDLFWRDGVDNVSVRDLEDALELRAPSIYRRYHSREQLVARCIDRYVEIEVSGRITRLLINAVDPLDGLRVFFTSVLRPHAGEATSRGCLLTNTAGGSEAAAPAVATAIRRGLDRIEAALADQLERAVAAGLLDRRLDVAATAKALLLSFQGLLLLARNGDEDLPAGVDAALAALLPPPPAAS